MYTYILDLRVGDVAWIGDDKVTIQSLVVISDSNLVLINDLGWFSGEEQVRVINRA